jgi:hypothetical protein
VLWPYTLLPCFAYLYFGLRGLFLTALPVAGMIIGRSILDELLPGAIVSVYQGGEITHYSILSFDWVHYLSRECS